MSRIHTRADFITRFTDQVIFLRFMLYGLRLDHKNMNIKFNKFTSNLFASRPKQCSRSSLLSLRTRSSTAEVMSARTIGPCMLWLSVDDANLRTYGSTSAPATIRSLTCRTIPHKCSIYLLELIGTHTCILKYSYYICVYNK